MPLELVSLLLLFLSFATLFAFLGKEFSFCLEPSPTTLYVSCSIFHRHFLANLCIFALILSHHFFVTLGALSRIEFNLFDDLLDLLGRLLLALSDVGFVVFNVGNLSLALRILFFVLANEQIHAFSQVNFDGSIDFLLGCQHSLHAVDFFLQLSLLFLVETVFTGLLALNLTLAVLDV